MSLLLFKLQDVRLETLGFVEAVSSEAKVLSLKSCVTRLRLALFRTFASSL